MSDRHVAVFDAHAPHSRGIPALLRFIRAYKPTVLILGGDFMDCQWASHWNGSLVPKIGETIISDMYKKDVKATMNLMAELAAAAGRNCERIVIPGNHERWLLDCAIKTPGLIEGLTFRIDPMKLTNKDDLSDHLNKGLAAILRCQLDTPRTGWRVLPYRQPLDIGKLRYLHGDQFNSPRSAARKYPGVNLAFGHFHTHDVNTLPNSGREGKAVQHVAVPCMTHLAPAYLKDRSTVWLNGFWIADFMAGGRFDGRVVKVMDGEIIAKGI